MHYDDFNFQTLINEHAANFGEPGCFPRATVYGSPEAEACGLYGVTDYVDSLIDPKDFKERIAYCHETKQFPMYYHDEHKIFDAGWMQSSYNVCWAYGLSAAVIDAMAEQGDKPVRLAPFSLGSLVGWRNRGYYPDRAISYAKTNGIASAEFVPEYNLNPSTFKAGWEQDALKYRPDEWWDTDRTRGEASMVQQCVSILCSGRPLYVAYDWWGHALQCCGVEWDESKRNNIVWVLRNSHGEKGCIRLSGKVGVPDFAAGVRSIRVAA